MPQQISCPNCMVVLKPSKLPPIGTKVRCPQCKEPFVLDQSTLFNPGSNSGPPVAPKPPTVTVPAFRQPTPKPEAAPNLQPAPNSPTSNVPVSAQTTAPWVWAIAGAIGAAIVVVGGLSAAGVFRGIPERALADQQPTGTIAPTSTVTGQAGPQKENSQPLSPVTPIANLKQAD